MSAFEAIEVCNEASKDGGAQTLALVLSCLFSTYIVVSVLIASVTIYNVSHAPADGVARA